MFSGEINVFVTVTIVSSANSVRKLDIHTQKDETRSLSYTTHKIN